MSIVRDTFYNIRCDSCGAELCEEWYHDVGNDEFATILSESGWFTADGNRHYCPDCWEWDDDDRIKTRDGHTYDEDGREIRNRRLNYLELSEGMTLTQMRTKLEQGQALYSSMVGSLYKSMLSDDLNTGYEWLGELLAERKGTPEWEAYHTFDSHGIFKRLRDEMYERMYNKRKQQ